MALVSVCSRRYPIRTYIAPANHLSERSCLYTRVKSRRPIMFVMFSTQLFGSLTPCLARCTGMHGIYGQHLRLCLLRGLYHLLTHLTCGTQLTSRTVDRLLLLIHGLRPRLARTSLHPMHHWSHSRRRFASHAGEPSVSLYTCNPRTNLTQAFRDHVFRWLIDVDRDTEGMQVLADLHGGDPEDLIAKAEFQEIKDRVIFEVCWLSTRAG